MAAVLFGFTAIQAKKGKEQYALQIQQDSIARVEAAHNAQIAEAQQASIIATEQQSSERQSIYKDASLDEASAGQGEILTLENDVFELQFNTKGAMLWSAHIKDFRNYDSTDLYIFRPGGNEYAVKLYTGEYINTANFEFQVAEHTDTTLAMRLYFADGGYIEQSYAISEGSYAVAAELAFVNMNSIPRNVGSFDIDFKTIVPRMEKGYKNESQYSKLNWYYNGEDKPEELGRGRSAGKKIGSKLSWFAFQQQFFSTIVRAPQEFASGNLSIEYSGEDDPDHNLMTCEAQMRIDFRPDREVRIPLEFYIGPNHFQTLKTFDQKYEKIIPLGGWLVGWFTRFVIIPLFNWLHKGIASFGLIILIMTILIKLAVFPLTYKSLSSSVKMQALKPELERLNEKYPKQEDAMKKQQATMDLYKRAGVKPLGGCLPTLLTFPILWAMFRFFPASIELRQQHFLWAEDLSGYDSIVDFGTRVPLLGDHLSLFALLMAVVMFLYSKMTTSSQPAGNDPSAASMKFMTVWMMPIMMFFICNNLSSGLSYYYLLSQLIAMIQMWIIKKSINPQKVLDKVEASRGKPLPKSKWQLKLEEAQKMQEQQMRAQQRRR
ncbi:MAG: membrane protein insertase YidC [Bacteroidales bacterium]|nr:membrane protein insertase YidC [Candidatus Cryptobacteroides aphodequi]